MHRGIDAGEVGLSARLDSQPYRQPKVLTVVGGADVPAALAHCVQRVQQTPGVTWGAIIADDKRVVGASLPRAGAAVLESMSALPNVGVRALAVLGAIEEPLRESWVWLRRRLPHPPGCATAPYNPRRPGRRSADSSAAEVDIRPPVGRSAARFGLLGSKNMPSGRAR